MKELIKKCAKLSEKVYNDLVKSENLIWLEDKKTDTQVAIIEEDEATYIVFRGTSSLKDSVIDLQRMRTDFKGVTAHRGFVKSYNSVAKSIKSHIAKKKPEKIIITGHSLGGAHSQLCAFDLYFDTDFVIDISVIAFGSPRVFGKKGAEKFRESQIHTTLIEHTLDIITSIPKFGYYKVADPVSKWRTWPSYHKIANYRKTVE
jgi:predicted lipase